MRVFAAPLQHFTSETGQVTPFAYSEGWPTQPPCSRLRPVTLSDDDFWLYSVRLAAFGGNAASGPRLLYLKKRKGRGASAFPLPMESKFNGHSHAAEKVRAGLVETGARIDGDAERSVQPDIGPACHLAACLPAGK